MQLIAAALITLWWLGLLTGYTTDLFIHFLVAAAIILLVISINQEVDGHPALKRTPRVHGYKK
jgi:hypothetical protein